MYVIYDYILFISKCNLKIKIQKTINKNDNNGQTAADVVVDDAKLIQLIILLLFIITETEIRSQ